MPLPLPLGSGEIRVWRLDRLQHASTWDSGEGSFLVGGRWNSRGRRAVYCALDPATAILEVAVHKTFRALDVDPHVLTSARVADASAVHIVDAASLPNAHWLSPGVPSAGQQAFGDDLLKDHALLLVPSAVSRHSWNAVFEAPAGQAFFDDVQQEPFALDPRLHPPGA